MTIQVLVIGERGAGKTHLIRKIEAMLRAENYAGVIDYGESGAVVAFDGFPRVNVAEIHGPILENGATFRVEGL